MARQTAPRRTEARQAERAAMPGEPGGQEYGQVSEQEPAQQAGSAGQSGERLENSSDYFSNRACKYFPCHKGADPDRFNCLFCFCPLYFLGRSCGGNFKYNKKGAKDCTYCQVPHKPENYDMIMEKLRLAIEAAAEAELAQQH